MSIWNKIAKQFGNPTGILGILAGFIMSHRSSNNERNDWGIELLNIKPTDNVLETGFGPGMAIEKLSKIVKSGKIYGIDHSDLMFKSATKRNKKDILTGKVNLITASVENLPKLDQSFDKVLDINSFQFWKDKTERLKEIKIYINNKGLISLVHQPRKPGATDQDADNAGQEFSIYLEKAGFKNIKIEKKIMQPVSTICVIGQKVS